MIEKAITNTLMNDEQLVLPDKTLTFRDVENNDVILYPNLSLWPSSGSISVPDHYNMIKFDKENIKFNRFNSTRIVRSDKLSHQLNNDEGESNHGTHFDYPTFVELYKMYHEPNATFDESKAIIKDVEIIRATLFKLHGKSSKGYAIFYNAKLNQCIITGCICGVQFVSCLFYKCKFDLKKLNHFNCKNCDFIECEFSDESGDINYIVEFNSLNDLVPLNNTIDRVKRLTQDRAQFQKCTICIKKIIEEIVD
jgi:hypothetical protein